MLFPVDGYEGNRATDLTEFEFKTGEGELTKIAKGGCLCGSITYELHGEQRPVIICHCNQCRKASGHFLAATQVEKKNLTVKGGTLKWYRSSEIAECGFCSNCGGNLFWRRLDEPYVSICAGTIDGPTGLKIKGQLYPEAAGDYYDIPNVPILDQASLRRGKRSTE
jgi:hypothetical protein